MKGHASPCYDVSGGGSCTYSYFGARYYNPEIGRWISRDSKPGAAKKPQSLNSYLYCVNNPLIYIDPNGKEIVFADPKNKEFIKAFNKATREMAKKSPHAKEILKALKESDIKFIITSSKRDYANIERPVDPTVKGAEMGSATIEWNPNLYILSDPAIVDPSLALFHELGHGYDALIDIKGYCERSEDKSVSLEWTDAEEKYNITVNENVIAKETGKPESELRIMHWGRAEEVLPKATVK